MALSSITEPIIISEEGAKVIRRMLAEKPGRIRSKPKTEGTEMTREEIEMMLELADRDIDLSDGDK